MLQYNLVFTICIQWLTSCHTQPNISTSLWTAACSDHWTVKARQLFKMYTRHLSVIKRLAREADRLPHRVQRSRLSGAVPLLPLYPCMALSTLPLECYNCCFLHSKLRQQYVWRNTIECCGMFWYLDRHRLCCWCSLSVICSGTWTGTDCAVGAACLSVCLWYVLVPGQAQTVLLVQPVCLSFCARNYFTQCCCCKCAACCKEQVDIVWCSMRTAYCGQTARTSPF